MSRSLCWLSWRNYVSCTCDDMMSMGILLKVKKRHVDTDNQKYAAFYTLRYTFAHHLCVKMIQFETVAEFTQKG